MGAQAYTATFYGQPEIAKKNVKKIFLSIDDGGHYEHIFSSEMTAEKMIVAHVLKAFIDDFVRGFTAIRRKAQASANRAEIYEPVLGPLLAERHNDIIHQVMPQCSLFLCGTIFRDLTTEQKTDPSDIPRILDICGLELVQEQILHIIDFAKSNKDKADRSWPVLLKSNTFFNYVTSYISGIRNKSAPTRVSPLEHQKGSLPRP